MGSNLPSLSICISRCIPRLDLSQILKRIPASELTGFFFFLNELASLLSQSSYSREILVIHFDLLFFIRKKCG